MIASPTECFPFTDLTSHFTNARQQSPSHATSHNRIQATVIPLNRSRERTLRPSFVCTLQHASC
jgi:hypothetical protein